MASQNTVKAIRILLINPNSSKAMTHAMEQTLEKMELPAHVSITPYTAPSDSPASINDGTDVNKSHDVVFDDLASASPPIKLSDFDAALVACFSVHPLVSHLAWKFDNQDARLAVTGIFEASILTALSLLRLPAAPFSGPEPRQWGIVTTGKFWEDHLAAGVTTFLGQTLPPASDGRDAAGQSAPHPPSNLRFAGVQSTGLNAGDFHGDVPAEVVRQKMREATARLLAGGRVDVVVMGCAGMAGLDAIIRDVAIETYGEVVGKMVYVVDGVKAGVLLLEDMVRGRRIFR